MAPDFLVVGAGIIGIAVARELRRRHGGSVLVLDKESRAAQHASGRNSGVIHAGVYYGAGSLKARLCVEGNRRLRAYCEEKGIAINRAGKVIVARDETDVAGLEELHRRSTTNGVTVAWLDEQTLTDVEPSARTAGKALHVRDTAVVDAGHVTEAMAADAIREGVQFQFGCAWQGVQDHNSVRTSTGIIEYGHLVNCAGVHADKLAYAYGVGGQYRILPFRGGYYWLSKQSEIRVCGNIYPVPDLRNPFLGVHFTRRTDGSVIVGPTALPLLGREQYRGLNGASLQDSIWMIRFLASLFRRNVDHFRSVALRELLKACKPGFFQEARGLVRGLRQSDLVAGRDPGIRAQLVDTERMDLINDFIVEAGPRSTHVLNAVSPAFTCSLPFAEHVVGQINLGA
ncbi:MAG: L-2-hydroxyglutarate oxidase [Chromatiales bacterium]